MAVRRKPRVVLVDDETHSRLLMKTILQRLNCEVVGEASNGIQAVEVFREQRPDLLMLDINMPYKTGEEALRDIIAEFPSAFVIMLTSVADAESVERCIQFGAANYIRKDTPIHEIKEIIMRTWQAFRKALREKQKERIRAREIRSRRDAEGDQGR